MNQNRVNSLLSWDSSVQNTVIIFWLEDPKFQANFFKIFENLIGKFEYLQGKPNYLPKRTFFLNQNRSKSHLKLNYRVKNSRKIIFWPEDPKF